MSDLAFLEHDTRLLVGRSEPEGFTLELWDLVPSPRRVLVSPPVKGLVRCVAVDAQRGRVALGTSEGSVRTVDARTLRTERELAAHAPLVIWDIAFDAEGRRFATASGDRTIGLWSIDDGRELTRLEGHTQEVYCVAFSPDGSRIASGSLDETVRLWDPLRGEETAVLRGHTARVHQLAFAPDGSFLVSLDIHGEVRVWDTVDLAGLTPTDGAGR